MTCQTFKNYKVIELKNQVDFWGGGCKNQSA